MALSDEVKARLDIAEVVSQYVPELHKAGRYLRARCPFHVERTPSFFVFPERQSWRCFGACASGGDVFAFVMRAESLSFSEALRLLTERAGVAIPSRRGKGELEPIQSANEDAARFFQECLASARGAAARSYLQRRGVGPEAIQRFCLGFSTSGGDELRRHLMGKGFLPDVLLKAGLVTGGQEGPERDMFRGRLMFPIRDEAGRVVGFGGRVLDDSTPKYLNTPRTPLFDKGHLLYGMDLAREAIRRLDQAVVVEGYMDVIAAHEHGYTNVVASMGTALTEHQVALLRGLASNFVLALDPDAAGQEATLRSLESSWRVFEQQGAVRSSSGVTLYSRGKTGGLLRVVMLPQGQDPDKFIRQNPLAWPELVQGAKPLLEYLFGRMAATVDLSTSQGKAWVAERLFPLIAALDSPFEQERYFRLLAETLGVAPATLEASLGRPGGRQRRHQPREAAVSPFASSQVGSLEEHTLALLLQHPDAGADVAGLAPEHFLVPENRALFTAWKDRGIIELESARLGDDVAGHLAHLLARELPPSDLVQRARDVAACVRRLEERRLRELKSQEELLWDQAAREGDSDSAELVQRQMMVTNERLRLLFAEKQG